MAAWVVPKGVQTRFLEKCDVRTRKELPVRKKMPPALPQSLGTDGRMPLLLLVGQVMVPWCSAGNKPQTPNTRGAVSCDRGAQGLMQGSSGLGQCS